MHTNNGTVRREGRKYTYTKIYHTCSDFKSLVQMIRMYRAKLVLDFVCKFALGKIGYLLFINNIITITRLI